MAQIFESPDGGKTIYSRQPHSIERKLVYKKTNELVERIEHWMAIVDAAEDNPALKHLLDQVEMMYVLTKKEK